MILTLSPSRRDAPLSASVKGDVLTLNGEALDFGPLPKGAILPRAAIDCEWIAGDVTRDGAGELTVPVILPHGVNAPEETRFPKPIKIKSGDVKLPPYEVTNGED